MVALAVSLATMPLLILAAKHLKLLDLPDGRLKTHMKATPVLGGIGITLGASVAVAFSGHQPSPELAAAWILATLGFLDDRKGLAIGLRIGTEVLAGAALYAFGFAFFGPWVWALPLSVVAVVGFVNAMNMLDGLDGLAGGVAAIASGSFAILFAIKGDLPGAAVAIAVVGACAGFLFFNFHPAKIFMGDCGSYFLGFALFVLTARLQRIDGFVGLVAGLLISGTLVLDSTFAMVRRILAGRSPFDGDRDHVYDRLARRLSIRSTSLAMYGLSAILATAGIALDLWV